MKTGIIILNYNNYYDTINCIQSVYQHCFDESLLTVIVDNGSDNDSIIQISTFLQHNKFNYKILNISQEIKNEDGSIVIIPTNENLGYAKGNNIGIRFLINQKVDQILILNNDILFTSNIIIPLVNCLNAHPELGLVSPLLLKDEKRIDYKCCRNNPTNWMIICESMSFLKLPGIKRIVSRNYILKTTPSIINNQIVFCDIISGACILAKTTTWEQLHGFDENTFLYYEESILFEKLKGLNLKTGILPEANAIHLGAKATKNITNTKILRIELESLLYFLKTYRSISIFEIALIKSLRLLQINILAINNWRKSLAKRSI